MSKPETPCLPGCREEATYPSNGIGWRNSDGVQKIHAPACPNNPKAEAPPKDISPGSAWQREAEANGRSLLSEAPPAPKFWAIRGIQFMSDPNKPAPPANVSEPWPPVWQAHFDRTEPIVYSLPKCLECGALVEDRDRGKHYNWHRKAETR